MSEMLLHLDGGLYRVAVAAESLERSVALGRRVVADARNWTGIAGSGGGGVRGRGMSCGSIGTLSSRWSARLSSLCRSPAPSSVRGLSLRQHPSFRRLPAPSCDALWSPSPSRNLPRFAPVLASSVTGMAEVEVMDAVQQRLMFEDECILVDEHDNVVGHDSKYNCHLMAKIEAENLLHRAFSVFLFNSKNELLLQKRSATKVTFPEVWTNTCCSHPLYRDSELIAENNLGVRNAAQRKLFDELGIVAKDAPVDDFTVLGRILYKAPSDGKWGEHELDYLLALKRDVEVKPNPDEVSDVQFVNKEQLLELVRKADAGEDGIKLSPWFRIVVDNFLFGWWKKLEDGTLPDAVDLSIHKL